MAGLNPFGVICEIMNDDGQMARMPDLEVFARKHDLSIISIADLIEYRLRKDTLVRRTVESNLPTRYGGPFTAIAYENDVETLLMVRRFINYLPANNREKPPVRPFFDSHSRVESSLDTLMPDNANAPYDMHELVRKYIETKQAPLCPSEMLPKT